MREIRKETLPGGLQVEDVMTGTSLPRNKTPKKKEVIVTFWRESNQESVRVTEISVRGNGESDRPSVRAKDALTGKEVDIVNFCTDPRTSKEILARVGVSYHSKNLAKYVNSLVNKGFLKMTIPETPNDPNQKYVKA